MVGLTSRVANYTKLNDFNDLLGTPTSNIKLQGFRVDDAKDSSLGCGVVMYLVFIWQFFVLKKIRISCVFYWDGIDKKTYQWQDL